MSGNTMLGRAGDRANAPRSQYLGQGGTKVIVPSSVEKVPVYRGPYVVTPARQANVKRALNHTHDSTRRSLNAVGTPFLSDEQIGNVNPTLDWRQALIEGNNAGDAPHGYSAFWGS